MKNRNIWRKLGDFALGKGFYIVLFLCVAAIGLSGYYLLQTAVGGVNGAPAGGSASVTVPDGSDTRQVTPAPPVVTPPVREEPAALPAPQPDDPEPAAEPPAEEEQDKTVSSVFTWPVKGAVLRDYSMETLALDPTLGDWRTHGGLDIAAAQGVQVLAISAGTVEKIYDDGLMGTTVVVDHGGGLQSWYCNLAPETAVAEGDTVAIGQTLGAVGATAIAEVGVESHLHLETVLDGRPVDPGDYLK